MLRRFGAPSLRTGGVFAAFALVCACSSRSGVPAPAAAGAYRSHDFGHRAPAVSSPFPTPTPTPTPRPKIDHIVIIIQENRSLDNLFNGFPGADTVSSGKTLGGGSIPLQPISLAAPYDNGHGLGDFKTDYDGGLMDGFDGERVHPVPGHTAPPHPAYGYVPQSETAPYWSLANQYVLADRMFASQFDASFAAHQYLIAGQAGHAVNNPKLTPWGCDSLPRNYVATLNDDGTRGPNVYPCFDYPTLGDELDTAHVFWRFFAPTIVPTLKYHSTWSAYDAVNHIRKGPDWKTHVFSPETRILSQLAKNDLAPVTWVVPSLANSDHAWSQSTTGPSWVASVVNAVGTSKYWKSTAIFIVWDDWGGWYDHVPPPQLDYDGLGIRVPLLVVSPYAKQNYVSHVQYEFGSILQFVEARFGLAPLAASDTRANSLEPDCFDFSQPPRPFVPIQAPMNGAALQGREGVQRFAPDDN